MRPVLWLAALWLFIGVTAAAQAPGVLHVVVRVAGPDGSPTPVPKHALLISDNPSTGTPRRVVTGTDGTVDVRLRAGNYTIESDQPQSIFGKGYQWTETIDVPPGGAVLELTDGNAVVGSIDDTAPAAPSSTRVDTAMLMQRWGESLVSVWTARTRMSGFVVDAGLGLIATSQRAFGDAARAEVQVSPSLKVEGLVVSADRARDTVVLRVDAGALMGKTPLALACGAVEPVALDRDVIALGIPQHDQQDRASYGIVRTVAAHAIDGNLRVPFGNIGGPVFDEDGRLIGVSSVSDDQDRDRRDDSKVVPLSDTCSAVEAARASAAAVKPAASRLPVEPPPIPVEAVKAAAARPGFTALPFRLTASDFEVAFITPAMVFASQQSERHTNSNELRASLQQAQLPPWKDFGNWTEYVSDYPPVLLVRITPKLSESFWTTVARGAAMSQGVNIPSVKRVRVALSRMRAMCGDTEVAPVHPFALDTDVGTATIVEGLYAYDPASFTGCANVRLMLYADKDPDRADTRRVDAAVIDQIRQDFAAYGRK